MNEREKIKAAIREAYAAKVAESDQWYPYCFASRNDLGYIDKAKAMGYSHDDLESIPAESIMGLGCGNPVSHAKIAPGDVVLDLGSGGGIDVFLAAPRVGAGGRVIGIDMTGEMVTKARVTAAHYRYDNVEFRLGEIENLPIESESIDIIISNCVINLAPDKSKVFKEAFRVLKPSGKILICDIVIEGKLPVAPVIDPDIWAYCMSGALTKQEFLSKMEEAGFLETTLISEKDFDHPINKSPGKILSITVAAHKPKQ